MLTFPAAPAAAGEDVVADAAADAAAALTAAAPAEAVPAAALAGGVVQPLSAAPLAPAEATGVALDMRGHVGVISAVRWGQGRWVEGWRV